MASNTFANIAAATSAGYKEVVTDRGLLTGVGAAPQIPARFNVKLVGAIVGQPGNAQTGEVCFEGDGASQVAAEAVALANLNYWRLSRYGADSAAANVSTVAEPGLALGWTPRTHTALTKDKN